MGDQLEVEGDGSGMVDTGTHSLQQPGALSTTFEGVERVTHETIDEV